MAFPSKVQEQAMIACQRQCCLCHRLKHTKMQCHQIVPKAKGGGNTLGNCIPLCLECHGEVEAYNEEHPIGTKYSAAELKRRRDDWYERVKNATPTALDARHTTIDRKLLARLCRKCPPHLAKAFFHDQSYGASFPLSIVQVLDGLRNFGDEVESQFLDLDLESLFADLRAKVLKMLKALSHADAVGETMVRILPEDESRPFERGQSVQD